MSEQGKPLLVIRSDRKLTREERQAITVSSKGLAERVGMEVAVLDGGLTAEVHRDLSALVIALEAQTEAITQLATSNMAMVDAMIGDAESEDGTELSRTYLDGSPR